jgi:hypothetical protein
MASEQDASRRSRACQRDAHGECAHQLQGWGSWDVRRPWDAPHVELCGCPCHSACLLGGRGHVLTSVFLESCTCPGSRELMEAHTKIWEQAGRPPERPFGGESVRWVRNRNQQRRAAAEAVRARAAGKSRAEIRDLLIAEMESRKIQVPSAQGLDALTDSIASGGPGDPSGWQAARILVGIVKRMVAESRGSRSLTPFDRMTKGAKSAGGNAFYSSSWDDAGPMATVILDSNAGQLLSVPRFPMPIVARIELQPGRQGGSSDDGEVVVHVNEQRVGVLSAADSPRYRQALEDPRRHGSALAVPGFASRTADGSLQIRIYAPDAFTQAAPENQG